MRHVRALAVLPTLLLAMLFGLLLTLPALAQDHSNQQALDINSAFTTDRATWQRHYIDVCWENPSFGNETERQWVKNAAANTWARYSSIEFIGWQKCKTRDKGIRININDEKPFSKGLGNGINGKKSGLQLNFTFIQWYTFDCYPWMSNATRKRCIQTLTVHEFGHALGFAHEYNDAEREEGCFTQTKGQIGNRRDGLWDRDSVMNYCNDDYLGLGILSDGDIAMVQHYYGKQQDNKLSFVVSSSHAQNADISYSTADSCSTNPNEQQPGLASLKQQLLLGEYRHTGHFNNSPLYQHTNPSTPFYIYQRRNGDWVIDQNTFNDEGDDELAIDTDQATYPWQASNWSNHLLSNSNDGQQRCGALVQLADGKSWIEKNKYQEVINQYQQLMSTTTPADTLTLVDLSRDVQLNLDFTQNLIYEQVIGKSRNDFRNTIRATFDANNDALITHIEFGHANCANVSL